MDSLSADTQTAAGGVDAVMNFIQYFHSNKKCVLVCIVSQAVCRHGILLACCVRVMCRVEME